MAAVRCPKCGAVNPDGHRRGARCHACREAFRKCRYCAHYDSDIVDCTNVHRREQDHVLDADEVLNCPEFASTLTAGRPGRPWYAPVRTFALTAFLTLAAALGAIHLAHGPKHVPVVLPVHASISAPETVIRDEGLDVVATVLNTSDRLAEGVEVLITGKSMAWLTCQSVTPPESFLESGPRSVSATFGDVPPGESRSISFHFVPSKTGEASLVASVTMANVSGSSVDTVVSEITP